LHDVDDVEALLSWAVSRSRCAGNLRPDERDDLITWLFECAWKLSEKYDPKRGSFSNLLYQCTSRGIADWHRSRYRTRWVSKGHVYERQRPTLVPLDALDGTLASGTGDLADGGDLELAGVLGAGDQQRARDFATLGLGTPR
jgi:DNA-directed RNA polymerase specialized sigma24 family protein